MSKCLKDIQLSFKNKSSLDLFYSALLFKMCSLPRLVSFTSNTLSKPILGWPLKKLVKYYIFPYFCAGETSTHSLQLTEKLFLESSITTILDHSVEGVDSREAWSINLQQKLDLLSSASKLPHVKFIPVKCTSFMCSVMLEELTRNVLLHDQQTDEFTIELMSDELRREFIESLKRLEVLCKKARDLQISILLDAEQSHMQPGIEVLARKLSSRFNPIGEMPILFNTYQMYLNRSAKAIKKDLNHSTEHNYIFAVKLVRGAYMQSERARAKHLHISDPIIPQKEDVDKCYNDTLSLLLQKISHHSSPSPSSPVVIMIATHNRKSIELATDEMDKYKIPSNSKHVHFAQILGICDHMSSALGNSGYNVNKLVCFGNFEEILPWLLRRLQENQDIFGAMQGERYLFMKELQRRLLS